MHHPRPISFCILTLSLLPSSDSKFQFSVFVYLSCSFLHFSECEPFFFYLLALYFLTFYASLYHSESSKNYGHLTPMYCCYLPAFILVLLMHFQPPLCISSDDTHHIMIGIFSLCACICIF